MRRERRWALFLHRNPRSTPLLVTVPETLYHGTSLQNLRGIAKKGIVAGGGYSPHRTKTRTAVFLASSPEAACIYAAAHGECPVVLAVHTPGMRLEPDYDDASTTLSVDLDELSSLVGKELRIGQTLSDNVQAKVERAIERLNDYGGDRAEPVSLDVAIVKGKAYLTARPHVGISIAQASYEAMDHYPDISWEEGRPRLVTEQFLLRESVSPARIREVYVEPGCIPGLPARRPVEITDFGHLAGEENDDEDFLDYAVRAFVPVTLPELDQALSP